MTSERGRVRTSFFISLVVLLAITSSPAVIGEHLFELGDGSGRPGTADIVGSASQPGCDWADLFDATPTQDEFNAAARRCGGVGAAFVADQRAQSGSVDDTTFATGSSKNDSPISSWQWSSGTVPAKDDVSNAYAFAALNDQKELIVYMGLERLAPTGDSHVDFEFSQSPVTLDKTPPCGSDGSSGPADGPPCEWVGERTVGDLLVVMDFRKGGSIGFLEIRRWNGTAYDLVETVGGEGCDAADTVCAFNNAVPIDGGPWPNYDSKGRVITTLDQNAFTEVGVNVTRLLGSTPCFVELRAKTRSSSSYSSTLKDFVLGGFDICSLEIDKSGSPTQPRPDLSKHGDPFTYRYTITNTGAGTLYLVSVIDSQLGDITDIARNGGELATAAPAASGSGSGCGTLGPGSNCSFDITRAVPDDADDPFQTSVTSSYSTSSTLAASGAGRTVITVSASDTFPLNLFQPSVDVTKSGDLYGTPGEAAHYVIDVVNTSSSDSPPLVHASITDTLLGNLLDPGNPYVTGRTCADLLPTGGSCRIEAARVVLPTDPDPLPNTVTATYNPQDFPNVITDSASHAVDIVHPSFSLTVAASPDRGYVGDTIDYTFTIVNTGDDSLARVSVVDTLLGDLTSRFPDVLAPGASAIVTVQRAIQSTDPDPVQNQVTATYQAAGLLTQVSRSAVFVVDRLIPCAKSPGYWKGGSGVPLWDDPSDPIAVAAGFYTNTPFPWLDPSLAGTTYLGVLNLNALGDVTRQLGFKYIAARLNQAAFGVTQSVEDLLGQIDVYFAAHPVGSDPQGDAETQGELLLGSLNDYFTSVGESQCP